MDYIVPSLEGESLFSLYCTSYTLEGESITAEVFEQTARAIGASESTDRMAPTTVNGGKAYIFEEYGSTAIMWYDGESGLMFQISADHDSSPEDIDEYLVTLAESVTRR